MTFKKGKGNFFVVQERSIKTRYSRAADQGGMLLFFIEYLNSNIATAMVGYKEEKVVRNL